MADRELHRIREGFPGQRSVVLPRSVVAAWLAGDPLIDMVPSDVGYYPSARWHFVDRPEGVPQLILIYCVEGEGWVRADGAAGRIRPGQVLVVPPNLPHSYGADSDAPWSIYWIHIAGPKANVLLRLFELALPIGMLFPGQDPALPLLFERIIHLLGQGYSADDLRMSALVLHQIAAHLIANRYRQQGGEDSHDNKIKLVMERMNRSLDQSLTLKELAGSVSLSESHFSFVFKKRTGFPPLDYFMRLKMQRACFLLDTTNLPVKVVAAHLGFDDPLYFSRCFRRIHNCSPAQYKTIQKG